MLAFLFGCIVLVGIAVVAGALVVALMPPRAKCVAMHDLRILRGQLRRGFGRWRVADIQRGIVREVRRNAEVSVSSAYLWTYIEARLAPEDFVRLAPVLSAARRETLELIEALQREPVDSAGVIRYRLHSAPELVLAEDPSVVSGNVFVRGTFVPRHVVPSSARTVDSEGITNLEPTQLMSQDPKSPDWLLAVDGKAVRLSGVHLVGRSRHADIRLTDPRVSAKHARLSVTPAGVLLEDLGSRNGTIVNGRQVSRASLGSGDLVSFGGSLACRLAADARTEPIAFCT